MPTDVELPALIVAVISVTVIFMGVGYAVHKVVGSLLNLYNWGDKDEN